MRGVKNYRYVPTKVNPADMSTKWMPIDSSAFTRWIHGPKILKLSGKVLETRCNLINSVEGNSLSINVERFSSFTRLVSARSQLLRLFR